MSTPMSELSQALDLKQVLSQFSAFAQMDLTKHRIEQGQQLPSFMEIQYVLSLAAEGKTFVQQGLSLSLHTLDQAQRIIQDARKGRTLIPKELQEIQHLLDDVDTARNTVSREFRYLYDLAQNLDSCSRLHSQLDQTLDGQGEIRENASQTLENLYAELRTAQQQAARKAREFLRRHPQELMESIVTSYSGRTAFLVKAGAKNQFGGLVHGSSHSGAAFYVEPASFVSLNNEIFSLQSQIEQEKTRICQQLSQEIKKNASLLELDLETLSEIDEALAKGHWIDQNDGTIPSVLKENQGFVIEHARHPLIPKERAVYNDYQLKDPQRVLMISGPNMGGKSVTIKTIGLFAYLAHSGFPVSAYLARFPYFENFFFDLSDNQSIQENLSTFSGHLQRIGTILNEAGPNSMILLDELGHGTDPLEGASLAQALLEELIRREVTVLTTTHYSQVKAFGKTNPNILVSSVEFDQKTLRPTYRYLPQSSGSSFAFNIARQFDIPEILISRAQDLKARGQTESQKQLEALEAQQLSLQNERKAFEKRMKDLHRLQREALIRQEELEKEKKALEGEYRQKLEEALEQKKWEADALIRSLREQTHYSFKALDQIDEIFDLPEVEEKLPEKAFKVGEYVKVSALNFHGEVVEMSKKKAVILSNGKRISVSLDQLEPMNPPKVQKKKKHQDRTFSRFPLELNLIGMRVEEGLQALDQYLDQAVLHRIKKVRIIHGMGSGKLRAAVWKDLQARSTVKHMEAAGPNQGGLGATLVELD